MKPPFTLDFELKGQSAKLNVENFQIVYYGRYLNQKGKITQAWNCVTIDCVTCSLPYGLRFNPFTLESDKTKKKQIPKFHTK